MASRVTPPSGVGAGQVFTADCRAIDGNRANDEVGRHLNGHWIGIFGGNEGQCLAVDGGTFGHGNGRPIAIIHRTIAVVILERWELGTDVVPASPVPLDR